MLKETLCNAKSRAKCPFQKRSSPTTLAVVGMELKHQRTAIYRLRIVAAIKMGIRVCFLCYWRKKACNSICNALLIANKCIQLCIPHSSISTGTHHYTSPTGSKWCESLLKVYLGEAILIVLCIPLEKSLTHITMSWGMANLHFHEQFLHGVNDFGHIRSVLWRVRQVI